MSVHSTRPGGCPAAEGGVVFLQPDHLEETAEAGLLAALSPQKRGRKKAESNPLVQKVAQLEKENERLQRKLKQAETIIEVQKKISEILGIPQDPDAGSNS